MSAHRTGDEIPVAMPDPLTPAERADVEKALALDPATIPAGLRLTDGRPLHDPAGFLAGIARRAETGSAFIAAGAVRDARRLLDALAREAVAPTLDLTTDA